MNKIISKNIFTVYQIIMTLVILPATYFLWFMKFENRHDMVLMLFSIPLFFGYIVPGIGTNCLKIWEFKAGIKLGRFTLLHGLMFSAASSFLAWLCSDILLSETSIIQFILICHSLAVVLGFWNWIFDTLAIKYGIAIIYNKPNYFNQSAETIAADYAPVYFGSFGGCFGIQIHLIYSWELRANSEQFWYTLILFNLITCIVPVISHCISSKVKHGYWGLLPYNPNLAIARTKDYC